MESSESVQLEDARKRTLSAIWEYNNVRGIREDNDGFTIDLASTFVELKSGDKHVSAESWYAAIGKHQTTFYRLNKLNKKDYLLNVLQKLNSLHLAVRENTFEAILLGFKRHVERQQKSMFLINPSKQEEIGRQLLLAYLPQRGYKEVPTGSGRIDIACFDNGEVRQVVETKIWRSRQYYLDGFDELVEYLKTEQLSIGYYIVFTEKLKWSGVTKNIPSKDCFWESKEGKNILVMIVDISAIPPSKRGRIKRKTMGVQIKNE